MINETSNSDQLNQLPHIFAFVQTTELTCNSFKVFRRLFDFGPGTSVFIDGAEGSPFTYELYRHRASMAGRGEMTTTKTFRT